MTVNQVFLATNGTQLARAECSINGVWSVEHLLEGHQISCLAATPQNPNVVYAGTINEGVLRTDDKGKTWKPCGLTGHVVKSIAVSPLQENLLFAGTKPPALFVSHDGGRNWSEVESFRRMRQWWWFTPAEAGAPYIQCIALSPSHVDEIVVGIEVGAVLRSSDAGKTWTKHLSGAIRDCHAMTYHITDGRWVYEAGGTGAAFSQDGGKTWSQPDQARLFDYIDLIRGGGVRASGEGLDRRYGYAVGADAVNPEVWYVSSSPGPMKAHREGAAEAFIYRMSGASCCEKLSGGLPQPLMNMPYALLCVPKTAGHLYAGLSNGDIWHTTDYGDHWQQLPVNVGSVWRTMIML